MLRAGSKLANPSHYADKITSAIDNIKALPLSDAQKDVFIKQLTEKPREADWSKAFTNDFLQ